MPIKGFFGQHRFLSNFYPCEIKYQGLDFFHTEGAYQAAKTIHPSINSAYAKYISTLESPRDAKRFGQTVPLRPDWEDVKFDIMLEFLNQKFSKQPFLNLLLSTDTQYLEEANSWHDQVYGKCYCNTHKGNGLNKLGELLMLVRDWKQI